MARLSVNLNKIALLRNQRDIGLPSVIESAKTVIKAGAHGITVHPRPDQRHIRFSDVDELAEMNLVNFRRLSQSPYEAIKKIEDKVGFLEEDSYKKRLEGIKAWRQSPVNKIYLAIGQESIEQKKTVDTVIEDRKNSGKDYITVQEFNAIMDLNKGLRF